jgi:hypothetical protein
MRTTLFCLLSMILAVSTVTLGKENDQRTSLPPVESKGELSLEEAIQLRRSVREFGRRTLALEDVSQLLWAAQGIIAWGGFRTAPSAGALYPLELYVVAGSVEGLSAGVHRYRPKTHELVHMTSGDLREPLASAALGQSPVRLGTVLVGAFDDEEVQNVLGLPPDHEPLGLMPVGRKR